MKKFKELSLINQAGRVYILSIIISLITSPIFGKLYIVIFKPILTGGLFPGPDDPYALFDGSLLAYFFFLPLFIFLLIKNKQWLIWLIGIALPMLITLIGGGLRETFWALILTAIGWLLAQGILLIKKKSR
ncbi:hypothetical protein KKH38_03770 [Patescibacteria group bacterium]|nr:hypothetical protein [Patescibacteria group bacterium]MBU4601021.1 hypothetical protein [Patescibacteria group bacterium]MCG2698615.1 hypothetical protein [Candidatus Parcubacteria bacterium]